MSPTPSPSPGWPPRVPPGERSSLASGLYAEQRSVAETLQHSLLLQALPSVSGVEIAARYLPGAEGVDIGGDWYDVVLLGGDRFAFVVGDVSGRGVRAASVVASLRFAARGFALEGHGPATILGHLARTLDFASEGRFATVLCGVIDTGRRKMVLGDAGVERVELRNVSPIVRQVIEKTGLGGVLVVTQ
jgi:serine phosphatase RsbU (regulator of sigma subunit)